MRLHFVIITEGSSDEALQSHLRNLCADQGADEVTGVALDLARLARVGHSVEAKLAAVMTLEPEADLVFIHRDADGRDPQPRYDEIAAAVAEVRIQSRYVAVVPVQETEAWLLVDEDAIRAAAGRPHGTRPLELPRPQTVEQRARPKEVLKTALAVASELRGRKLSRFKREFPHQRRLLLQQLPLGGPLEHVPSWRRLRADIGTVIAELRPE